ncbi:hypothetical protein [Pseudomonas sp. BN515]|uniref:hypothetical protein n=1 Tax=Pseudomonas sp. BN515 TaxID=2567892 RepID=UPI0024570E51|nr:hypothetical protein [Pseudomonas sp. BN515]MDH4869835.1 hypothetical protein [Pseudomonas sp. BN515]
MQGNGHNNRIAGRDYYELNAELKLTPEQLRSLTISPCTRCEVRMVQGGRVHCNHCVAEMADKKAKEQMAVFTLAVFFVWGALLQVFKENGHNMLLELGVVSVVIVLMLHTLWSFLREWWLMCGDDVLAALGNALARIFKS